MDLGIMLFLKLVLMIMSCQMTILILPSKSGLIVFGLSDMKTPKRTRHMNKVHAVMFINYNISLECALWMISLITLKCK